MLVSSHQAWSEPCKELQERQGRETCSHHQLTGEARASSCRRAGPSRCFQTETYPAPAPKEYGHEATHSSVRAADFVSLQSQPRSCRRFRLPRWHTATVPVAPPFPHKSVQSCWAFRQQSCSHLSWQCRKKLQGYVKTAQGNQKSNKRSKKLPWASPTLLELPFHRRFTQSQQGLLLGHACPSALCLQGEHSPEGDASCPCLTLHPQGISVPPHTAAGAPLAGSRLGTPHFWGCARPGTSRCPKPPRSPRGSTSSHRATPVLNRKGTLFYRTPFRPGLQPRALKARNSAQSSRACRNRARRMLPGRRHAGKRGSKSLNTGLFYMELINV